VIAGSPNKVLEIGTGSGYQAAVLAQLVEKVYTVERIAALASQARQRFRQLGLRNIRASHSDGTIGLRAFAPYDAIIVTAAAESVPDELLQQLAPGGRLVIPVGGRGYQVLRVITRLDSGFESEDREAVVFVPLLKGQA
jgi:protein-L-isoaspartate(D-aspartate) O-methyltransferase